MHFASFFGNFFLIKYLLDHGGDYTMTNACSINMLHVAAQGDQPVSMAFFLKLGLNVNSRDKRLSTPLHWAAFAGADVTVSYLLALGADINAQDVQGNTPLALAIQSGEQSLSQRAIRSLIHKGADCTIANMAT